MDGRLALSEFCGESDGGVQSTDTSAPPAMNFSLDVHWADGGHVTYLTDPCRAQMSRNNRGSFRQPGLAGTFLISILSRPRYAYAR